MLERVFSELVVAMDCAYLDAGLWCSRLFSVACFGCCYRLIVLFSVVCLLYVLLCFVCLAVWYGLFDCLTFCWLLWWVWV